MALRAELVQISLKFKKVWNIRKGGGVKPIWEKVRNFPVFDYDASPYDIVTFSAKPTKERIEIFLYFKSIIVLWLDVPDQPGDDPGVHEVLHLLVVGGDGCLGDRGWDSGSYSTATSHHHQAYQQLNTGASIDYKDLT